MCFNCDSWKTAENPEDVRIENHISQMAEKANEIGVSTDAYIHYYNECIEEECAKDEYEIEIQSIQSIIDREEGGENSLNSNLTKISELLSLDEPDAHKLEMLINKTYGQLKWALIHVFCEPCEIQDIAVGNILTTTTSNIEGFSNVSGQFCKETYEETIVLGVHIGRDYSDYDINKCRNGGKYGYDFWYTEEIIGTGQKVHEWMKKYENCSFMENLEEY